MSRHAIDFDFLTGTLRQWRLYGINLLYPETVREIDGKNKKRGGAFCCLPFGTVDHPQVSIPRHGVLRNGEYKLIAISSRGYYSSTYHLWVGNDHFPWKHQVQIGVDLLPWENDALLHTFEVSRWSNCNVENDMPISMGLHPFFATFGKSFSICYGGSHKEDPDVVEGVSSSLRRVDDEKLLLYLGHGTVIISLTNSDYSGFCVWTDDKNKYICVEPVMLGTEGFGSYQLLKPGESRLGKVVMMFIPR